MMSRISLLALVFLSLSSLAQIREEVAVIREMPKEIYFQKTTTFDTIDLPILEDFSKKSTFPDPQYWSDGFVYVNSTFATGLKSIGAATFDGLDEYGFPYDYNYSGSDSIADKLTSKYIRLKNAVNVALSFQYQRGGLGEFPEFQDSLTVQFWSPLDSTWKQVWKVRGTGAESSFSFAVIPVNDPGYLENGFRFRFAAFGARNGAFDVWNIDYIELDSNRTLNDTVVQEPAFVKNHPFLTGNFNELPWFHFNSAMIKDTIMPVYRRNGIPPVGGWALNLGKYIIQKDGVTIKDRLTVPVITNLNHNVDISFPVPVQPINLGAINDEFTLFMKTWFDGTAEGLRSNDTIERSIDFKNYYAIDDGSAERAYGILNQTNARVAFQFQPVTPDTLRGLYINFAQAGVNATLNRFRIAIWRNNNGEPGTPIYISDSLYKPIYGYYYNDFMPFDLDTGIYIPGSVFIGFIQQNADALHVGLDMNSTRMEKFYGNGFNWFTSLAPGNLMIRPYFKYTPKSFGFNELPESSNVVVYPNPAQDFIFIQCDYGENLKWDFLNAMGQIIQSGTSSIINTEGLPRGLYIVNVFLNEQNHSHKIILN